MTEADEVALTLVQQWFQVTDCTLEEYVREMLPGESEVMISNVKESLYSELLKYHHDGKLRHVWVLGAEVGMRPTSILADLFVCKNCGVLKGNPKYPETACKGKVAITLRST